MNQLSADLAKSEFKDRLAAALKDAGVTQSASVVAREYNLRADGPAVTIHAVRKWLLGESLPAQMRLVVLANWLQVSPQWLRFGDGANDRTRETTHSGIPHDQVILLSDFRRLDERSQAVIKDMVALMLKHHSLRK